MKIRDIMTRQVTSVGQNSTLGEVAGQMKNLNVGSIPVCDNNSKLLGIVTDRDMVVRGLTQGYASQSIVRDVMTANPVFVTPDTDVTEATNLMAEHQVRRLPVVEGDSLVGIVSIGDVAVRDRLIDEAGDALSNISEPSRPNI
ncbi:CBS domain-containing protein [Anaerosalibacter sp. Marseille-P3206]|uniref:CBS domain-containing protein n=1 Tax=Anaerosalibacter sp. Marseille-P3206 TaxID=1871005 RepID=UPI00190ED4CB|nr:CBS domain-containing protein [Anaerosalibacter sp. Marseille-P3206]